MMAAGSNRRSRWTCGARRGMPEFVGLAFAWICTFLSLTALGWAVLDGIRLYRKLAARRRPASATSEEPIERLLGPAGLGAGAEGTGRCRARKSSVRRHALAAASGW